MTPPFAPLHRTLAAVALLAFAGTPAFAQTPPPGTAEQKPPSGHHLKECHGYVRHVSDLNIRVHCIDGDPSDQSFLYLPRYAKLRDGKSIQTTDLKPDTPVHLFYTQSLGVKKAYEIYVADPEGHGLYGFRS
jgi:hypothetical protein